MSNSTTQSELQKFYNSSEGFYKDHNWEGVSAPLHDTSIFSKNVIPLIPYQPLLAPPLTN